MPCGTVRNLYIEALRSFVTVAELGGVTRAAERLNLTLSAVSMQLKRLEAALDQRLVARQGRGIGLTREGEQLLGYGRRMVRLNDEAWDRVDACRIPGAGEFQCAGALSGPMSAMMRDFINAYPEAGIDLVSSISRLLLTQFEEGRLDVMLTTEPIATGQGECLYRGPLCWYAGRGSLVYEQRPLPLAAKPGCIFLPVASRALEAADIAWSLPYEATDWRDLTAFVAPASPSMRTCLCREHQGLGARSRRGRAAAASRFRGLPLCQRSRLAAGAAACRHHQGYRFRAKATRPKGKRRLTPSSGRRFSMQNPLY